MATQIGFISAIIGTATATTPDGSSRQLQAGDKVYQNELITTGSGGAIEIQFNDGGIMDMGRESQAMLDTGVFDPAMPATAAAETVDDDVEAIQQALLEGEDPTVAGEATAAGPGAGVGDSEGGSSFVSRDYLNPEVIPTSGFDTIGVSREFDQPEELNLIVVDEGIVDGTPSTDVTIGLVDEDDLGFDFQLAFVGPSAIISAFELDTGLNAQFPFVFGNNDEAGGDDLPPDSSPSQTGTLNANFGSDGAGTTIFNSAASQPAGLTSGGEPVQFWVSADGGMLVGYVITDSDDAEVIFTAELDPLSLDYAFTLHGPLDHADDSTEDNLLINLSYEISDSDGDSADGILQINVDDDSPLVTLTLNSDQQSELPLSIVVDESVGTDGSTKDEPSFADNDDETVSADETDIGYATVSGGDLFNVDVDAGADGENFSARSFALSLALPTGEIEVDSGLDATNGGDIMLSLDGDDIVGMDNETTVFRISIDANTGDVSVSQYAAIDHGDDDNNHDALININEGLIGANVTVYDNDGDSATSEDVELGSLIGFEDDGPAQTVTVNAGAAAALAVELDETEGDDRANTSVEEVADGNTDDAGPGLAQVTTAVAGGLTTLFTVSGSYGSDGAGTVNGALSFTGVPAEGLNTSLSATDGGAITLYLENDELVGRDGGDEVVFTVAIVESPTDSGEYQLQTTLLEAIDHGDDGNLYDSVTQLLLPGEGEVQLQYAVTRTDGDGDEVVASDQVTLIDAETSVFSFDDDGPAQTVTVNAGAADVLAVELDETAGDDRANASLGEVADGNIDDAGPGLAQVTTSVTGGLTTLFTVSGSYGSDGAGTVNSALSFTGVPAEGLNTSLSATDGGAITLYLENDELVGRDGDNHIVFTMAIVESPAESGEYQLQTTLLEAIEHVDDGNFYDSVTQLLLSGEGEVQLQYAVTRTDGDGDEAVASDQVTLIDAETSVFSFDDDGPEVTLTIAQEVGQVIVDESVGTDGSIKDEPGLADNDDETESVDVTDIGYATISGSNLFNLSVSPGSDGEDVDARSFALTLALPDNETEVASGLEATDGGAVMLSWETEGSVIVGTDGDGHVVFRISMDADTGNVTLSQYEAINHGDDGNDHDALLTIDSGLIGANVSVFDNDGDSATSEDVELGSLIGFEDDGPKAKDDGDINVAEDTPVSFDVFGNDEFGSDGVDTDNAPSIVVTYSDASNGAVSYDGQTGLFTYTPNAGYAGSDSFTYTLEDGDGDTSTATVSLLVAADSTPQVGETDNLTVDEDGFDFAANDDETSRDDETDSSESLTDSGTVTVNFGNDVPVSLLNSIVLVDEVGLDSQLTSGGEPVVFALELGALVGRADGTEVIRIEITSAVAGGNTGEVDYSYQVTLSQPVEHVAGALENSELLSGVKFTVTDSDDSTADGTFNVSIVDDVPAAENDGVINVAEDTATTFSVFGNDEFGADDVDTDNDPSVVVTHSSASNGTVSYNAGTGQFTYTPNAGYAGADSFTYTIKDGDGDTSTATVSLLVAADSTPQVGQTTNLTVDEDGFAYAADDDETSRDDETDSTASLTDSGTVTVDFGNDVPANLLNSIVLVDDVGLDSQLVSGGQAVIFALDVDGDLVGTVDSGATEVIRIEISNAVLGTNAGEVDYSYKVTLSQPIEHTDGALENSELLSGIKFTVTDSDNSPADGTFDVTIVDDVPGDYLPTNGLVNNKAGETINESLSSVLAIGADNFGGDTNVTFNAAQEGDSGLTSGGDEVYYYVSDDGKTLTASTSLTEGDVTEENTVFTVDIDETTDTYSIEMLGTLDNNSGSVFGNLSGTGPAGNPPFKIVESTSEDDLEILFTPLGSATSVNSDSDDVGVGSQFIELNDGLRVDFGQFTYDDKGTGNSNDDTFIIDSKSSINGFRFGINQISGGTTATMTLAVFDSEQPFNQLLTDDDSDDIDRVEVYASDGSDEPLAVWIDGSASGDPSIIFTDNSDGTVTVSGLQTGYNIATYTDDGYDSIEILNEANPDPENDTDGKFSLDNLQVLNTNAGDPISESFDTVLTDADGDTSESSIDVTFAPASAITGTSGDDDMTQQATTGNDIIFGGAGNDTIVGGLGDDILSGGVGNDIFVWNESDDGTQAQPAHDTITDFNLLGDVLNLADLLQGEGYQADGDGNVTSLDDLSDYLTVVDGGTDTIIEVRPNGTEAGPTQLITLEGVSYGDITGANSAEKLTTLIDSGNLQVDQS